MCGKEDDIFFYISWLTTLPIELTETVTVSPETIGPNPELVPHAIMSPGFRVISCERWLTIS